MKKVRELLLLMRRKLMALLVCAAGLCNSTVVYSQDQSCPANINFAAGSLSMWSAQTGLVNGPTTNYPAPNSGRAIIPEYTIATKGITVLTTPGLDTYGGFTTVPTINGYAYSYSVKLGSNSTSFDLHSNSENPGGFTRAITYIFQVPPGSRSTPYTMTYAYAMVLENGTHNSDEQPMFKATLTADDSIITCASPHYYLPTFNNAGGGGGTGATLDSATALAEGFTNSSVLFLSHSGTAGSPGRLLRDVWTKGWTEVTFDLSPFRGKQIKLTFEADNCLPGAHFAYAYVALRNSCAGLEISGPPEACINTIAQYSVPALANATYHWQVPAGWIVNGGSNTSIITVTPGATGGKVIVNEKNGCADLKDTIDVTTRPPTVAGRVINDNRVCAGNNSTVLNVTGNVGGVVDWLSSVDGGTWVPVGNQNLTYNAQNLLTTTAYRALVQNGGACAIDSSAVATILVDPKTQGGHLVAGNPNVCAGQTTNSLFTLINSVGTILNWQQSNDNTNWNGFVPAKHDTTYEVNGITQDVQFRAILKSGVCPSDTSTVAALNYINVPFPIAIAAPDSTYICYGKTTPVDATITIGTSYTWTHRNTLANAGDGSVHALPLDIHAIASPITSTDYVLTVFNSGCPNPLLDTAHVEVAPKIIIFAGDDTSIVANQPLQLNALLGDSDLYQFNWTPSSNLNFSTIRNPIALFTSPEVGGSITYIVRATNAAGCYAEDTIVITLFKTGPDIFVPSGFTPNGDGRNDILKPICVGIKELTFFRVYNRWGQMVFHTSQFDLGWDGTISGRTQDSGNFVYIAQGIDFNGNKIFRKGNVMLIR